MLFQLLLGSGASCIYPLLGAKLNNWHFLATEVNDSSTSYAKENVKRNGLENNISGKANINIIILLLFRLFFLHVFRHVQAFVLFFPDRIQSNNFSLRK